MLRKRCQLPHQSINHMAQRFVYYCANNLYDFKTQLHQGKCEHVHYWMTTITIAFECFVRISTLSIVHIWCLPYTFTGLNSPPPSPSAACMCQWTGSVLVQIMACRLLAPSHYLNQCWVIVNWTIRNKLQWNFNQNTKFAFTKMYLKISSVEW